jgi:hypothetical protein
MLIVTPAVPILQAIPLDRIPPLHNRESVNEHDHKNYKKVLIEVSEDSCSQMYRRVLSGLYQDGPQGHESNNNY